MARIVSIKFPILRFMFPSLLLMLTAKTSPLTFYMSVPPAPRATRYLTLVLRWLLIVAGVFMLTKAICTYFIDYVLPQVYTATAKLQVPASDLTIPAVGSGPEPVAFQPEFENTIRSPDFLLSVIKDLGLEQAWAKRLYKSDDQLPDVDALTHMENVLKFRNEPGTNMISITASSDLPQEATDIANAVADRYKTMLDVEVDQQTNRGADSLRDQIAEQQRVVEEKRAAVEKIRQELGKVGITIPSSTGKASALLQAFHDAQHDLDQQQAILDALNVRLKQVMADSQLQESPVQILSRAEIPTVPTHPNRSLAFVFTMAASSIAGLLAASFVEIIFLFLRAAERTDN
jgi:uncharacterized protein involved in exopolysaccharide biosynthesis